MKTTLTPTQQRVKSLLLAGHILGGSSKLYLDGEYVCSFHCIRSLERRDVAEQIGATGYWRATEQAKREAGNG